MTLLCLIKITWLAANREPPPTDVTYVNFIYLIGAGCDQAGTTLLFEGVGTEGQLSACWKCSGGRDGIQLSFFVSESGQVGVRLPLWRLNHCEFRSQTDSFSFPSSSVFRARTLSALYASGEWPAHS